MSLRGLLCLCAQDLDHSLWVNLQVTFPELTLLYWYTNGWWPRVILKTGFFGYWQQAKEWLLFHAIPEYRLIWLGFRDGSSSSSGAICTLKHFVVSSEQFIKPAHYHFERNLSGILLLGLCAPLILTGSVSLLSIGFEWVADLLVLPFLVCGTTYLLGLDSWTLCHVLRGNWKLSCSPEVSPCSLFFLFELVAGTLR